MSKLTRKLKENLESEISILKSLQHPHIVALFSCTETPLYIYLVMEYCQLSDLAQFMKKRHTLATLPETADIFRRYPNPVAGGLHEALSRHFLKQIASALQYLRGRNLIHRDIKPQNLLLNPAPAYMSRQNPEHLPLTASEHSLIPAAGIDTLPMLKIADFGFARHLPSTSMAETLCGSPLYMAPEILRYEKYDARADLWSTGTVLHEMVVGKPPFRAQNHVELLRRIEKANDQIIFDNKNMTISRAMKDCIRKLLKKSPLDRVTYEEFFADPVVTADIPGLATDDLPQRVTRTPSEPQISEISRRIGKASIDRPALATPTAQPLSRVSQEEVQHRASRQTLDPEMDMRRDDGLPRRKPSIGSVNHPDGIPIPRQSIQRQQQRPNMIPYATAPTREALHFVPASAPAPRIERRTSRNSPLAGPPMVREPLAVVDTGAARDARALREAHERTAHDIQFEKEYVVIEKRAVEVNAFADELDANAQRNSPSQQTHMIRRATTTGPSSAHPPPSPSRAGQGMQLLANRTAAVHQRAGSFERRYVPAPQSATNMLTKALNAANVRLFGAVGTSPPFGKGPSPPRGYGAFPAYPTSAGALMLGEAIDGKGMVMDEDTKAVRTMEEAAHRSDVIFGFAEVKYKQLVPATPATAEMMGGITQLQVQHHGQSGSEVSGEGDSSDMTTAAVVGVAEEALVLYVKTLAILAKTIDDAGAWWSKRSPTSQGVVDGDSTAGMTARQAEVGKRMNSVVQWTRNRFNECLEKSEVVGRRLTSAQRLLPADHPGHPNNNQGGEPSYTSTEQGITMSADHIRITTGVTAERLMFDRAVEMSRAAAVSELVNEELADCELGYMTAVMLLEAVLEGDETVSRRRGSTSETGVKGLEGGGEAREMVGKCTRSLPSSYSCES